MNVIFDKCNFFRNGKIIEFKLIMNGKIFEFKLFMNVYNGDIGNKRSPANALAQMRFTP